MSDGRSRLSRRRFLAVGTLTAAAQGAGCLRLSQAEETPGGSGSTADQAAAGDSEGDDSGATGGDSSTAAPTATAAGASLVLAHAYEGDLTDGVNGIDGTPAAGGLEFVESTRGTALRLAGDDAGADAGFYDVPDAGLAGPLSSGDPLSVSLWLSPDALDGWEMVLNGDGVILDLRSGEFRFRWYQGGSVWRVAVPADDHLTPGTWSHVAGTVEPGGQARLYVDGRLVGATPAPSSAGFVTGAKADHLRVGYHPRGDDGGFDSHFGGRLDDLRLYRGVLDQSTVQRLAGSG